MAECRGRSQAGAAPLPLLEGSSSSPPLSPVEQIEALIEAIVQAELYREEPPSDLGAVLSLCSYSLSELQDWSEQEIAELCEELGVPATALPLIKKQLWQPTVIDGGEEADAGGDDEETAAGMAPPSPAPPASPASGTAVSFDSPEVGPKSGFGSPRSSAGGSASPPGTASSMRAAEQMEETLRLQLRRVGLEQLTSRVGAAGSMPIHLACGTNPSVDVVRALLVAGGLELLSATTHDGDTPVHVAGECDGSVLSVRKGALSVRRRQRIVMLC